MERKYSPNNSTSRWENTEGLTKGNTHKKDNARPATPHSIKSPLRKAHGVNIKYILQSQKEL